MPEILDALGYLRPAPEAVSPFPGEITAYSTLNLDEFCDSAKKHSVHVHVLFDEHDADGSGCICLREMGSPIKSLGITPNRATLTVAL